PDLPEHLGQWSDSIPAPWRHRMIVAAFNKVSFDERICGGYFPFRLGRQSRPRPVCVCVRFIVTHVAYRLCFVHFAHSRERHHPPSIVLLLPIERRSPSFALQGVPSVREPEFG